MLRNKDASIRILNQKYFLLTFWRQIHQTDSTIEQSKRNFLDIVAKKLNVKQFDDWYLLDFKSISDVGNRCLNFKFQEEAQLQEFPKIIPCTVY